MANLTCSLQTPVNASTMPCNSSSSYGQPSRFDTTGIGSEPGGVIVTPSMLPYICANETLIINIYFITHKKDIAYPNHVDDQLKLNFLVANLHWYVFFDNEFRCFAVAPIPWSQLIVRFRQSRKPFLSGINQLKATLRFDQFATFNGQIGGRRTQIFISLQKENKRWFNKLLYLRKYVNIFTQQPTAIVEYSLWYCTLEDFWFRMAPIVWRCYKFQPEIETY